MPATSSTLQESQNINVINQQTETKSALLYRNGHYDIAPESRTCERRQYCQVLMVCASPLDILGSRPGPPTWVMCSLTFSLWPRGVSTRSTILASHGFIGGNCYCFRLEHPVFHTNMVRVMLVGCSLSKRTFPKSGLSQQEEYITVGILNTVAIQNAGI